MKKLVLLGVLTGLLFSSCSEYEPNTETDVVENFVSMDDATERVKLDMIFEKLDSLNQTIPTRVSRGGDKGRYITYADFFGALAGGEIGGRLGGHIGKSLGPVGSFLGSMAGHFLGHELGYKGASALTRKIIGCSGLIGMPNNLILYSDCSIQVAHMMTIAEMEYAANQPTQLRSAPWIDEIDPTKPDVPHVPFIIEERYEVYDSIGHYHNMAMVLINNDDETYTQNGQPNIAKIYDDIVLYSNQQGIDSIAYLPEVKSEIILMISDLSDMAFKCLVGNLSMNKTVDLYKTYMSEKYNITEEDILIIDNFYVKILEKCSTISIEQIHDYAASLNALLEEMEISAGLRVEMALGVQAIINSSLCWNQ